MRVVLRRIAWLALPIALSCSSSDEEAPPTTAEDVIQSCNTACAKQTACVPPAPLIDCVTVCNSGVALDTGAGCSLTAQKARYDLCGLLTCVNIGSCVVDASLPCRGSGASPGTGGSPPSTGGASGGRAGATGGVPAASGGTAGATGGAPATGGASGVECVACDARANACCKALAIRLGQDPTQCDDTTEAKCRAAPAAEQPSYADQCRNQVATGAMLGIAECQ
jgi:hypothetical protein